jgi:hypothetical protein
MQLAAKISKNLNEALTTLDGDKLKLAKIQKTENENAMAILT